MIFDWTEGRIGERASVGSGVYIGPDVVMGPDCVIAPNASIGGPGFGYERLPDTDGSWTYKDHPFGVRIGDHVHVGSNTTIHRGRWRHTEIGPGTKIDANVFIAHNVVIGRDCLVIAGAHIGGSCEIGDRAIIGIGATLSDHVKVGWGALVGAGAVVVKDVPEGAVVVGNPAKYLRDRRVDDLT